MNLRFFHVAAVVVVILGGMLYASVWFYQTTDKLDELQADADQLTAIVNELTPKVSLLTDQTVHGIEVEWVLLDICGQQLEAKERSQVCEAFVTTFDHRVFFGGTDELQVLEYIVEVEISNQLITEGWNKRNRSKWDQGLSARQDTLGLLLNVLNPRAE